MPIFLPPPESPPALIVPAPAFATQPAALLLTNGSGIRFVDKPALVGVAGATLGSVEVAAGVLTTLDQNDLFRNATAARGRYLDGAEAQAFVPVGPGKFGVSASAMRFNSSGAGIANDAAGSGWHVAGVYKWTSAEYHNEVTLGQTSTRLILGMDGSLDKYTYQSVTAQSAFTRNTFGGVVDLKAKLEQGLGGSRDVADAVIPHINSSFTVASGTASFTRRLSPDGSGFSIKTGGHAGSADTPFASQFALGGMNRGSAYHAGVASAQSGAYADLTYNLARHTQDSSDVTWQPYVGVNGAIGQHVMTAATYSQSGMITTDKTLKLASAEAGVKVDLSRAGSANLNVATPIDNNVHQDKVRLNVTMSMPF